LAANDGVAGVWVIAPKRSIKVLKSCADSVSFQPLPMTLLVEIEHRIEEEDVIDISKER
jgi:hypothetical protein